MGVSLPVFESGQLLTAAALNGLAGRVRALQRRLLAGGGVVVRRRRVLPGRRFAFQLAELNGGIWFRQGWLDVGGVLTQVGDEEWNFLGAVRECTVWLLVERVDGAVRGSVVLDDGCDLTTPATALRRRLGYVRLVEDGGGFVCVQVAGGLFCPAAPRRQQGVPADGAAGWRRADGGALCEAGVLRDEAGGEVRLNYGCALGGVTLPRADGGPRLGRTMFFDAALYR